MTVWAVSLALLAANGSTPSAKEACFLGQDLGPGPFSVGFRVLDQRDPGRRFEGGERPLQIGVWYPAEPGNTRRLAYEDYVVFGAAAATLTVPAGEARDRAVAGYRAFLEGNGVPGPGIEAWLRATMAAHLDVPAARGPFPLVLVAPGNGGLVQDQAGLGEYLASHGHVVATTPSPTRFGAEMASEKDILPVAREGARDLDLARERLRSWPAVDAKRFGIVGYSFGARSALLAATTRDDVRALVSLDGGIGSKTGKGWLPASSPEVRNMRVPILHFFEEVDGFMAPDFDLLGAISGSERLLLRVDGMRHLDLITLGLARTAMPQMGVPKGESERLLERIRAVFTYTRAFLEANLEGEGAGRSFLARDPSENGFAPGLLRLSRMPPEPRAR